MKLSVITVNLNNAVGLQKTIESVSCQTFEDFEYIIVDGASIDDSIEIIQNFILTKRKHIKCISELDSGIYEAMNKGIRLSQGTYLLFLNSGDYLKNNEVLNNFSLQKYTEEIISFDCDVTQNDKFTFKVTPPDKVTLKSLYMNSIPHQSTFIHRDLFDKVGFYSAAYKIHSDLDFFIRALILNSSSYRRVPISIAVYNLEGISSATKNRVFSLTERKLILNSNIPERIIMDYDSWKDERDAMKDLYWVKSNKLLYRLVKMIYKCARIWNKTKNSLRKF